MGGGAAGDPQNRKNLCVSNNFVRHKSRENYSWKRVKCSEKY